MDAVVTEVRQALRGLRRAPGLVVLAIAALAMGIGFPTTMFSIVRGATRPLPFAEPEELVVVSRTLPARGITDLQARPWDVLEWQRQQTSLEEIAAFHAQPVNIAAPDARPERQSAAYITPNTFDIIDSTPALGRGLRAEDARVGAEPVVLLGDALWRTRFSSDPAIVGRVVRIDGIAHTVIGVMPRGLGFPVSSELWLPLVLDPSAAPEQGPNLYAFGRLREGVSLEQARLEMATIAARIEASDPVHHDGMGTRVFPFVEIEMDTAMVPVLYFMVSAVSLVLLIACANVANMLLARAASRTKETAVRSALGASRRRILAQHLVETALIASVGGAIGVVAAHAGVRWFDGMASAILQAFWIDFRVDGGVLAFSASLIAIAALAAGIGPALQASRTDVASMLKDTGPGTSSLRVGRVSRGLVVAEIALSCALLALAAIMVRAAVSLRAVDFPFDAESILTAQLALPQQTLDSRELRNTLVRSLGERLEDAPGLDAAALISQLPGRGAGNWSIALDGTEDPAPTTGVVMVTPAFLDVLNGRVVRGRSISWADDENAAPIAVVNESFVARFSPDRDPLGRRVRIGTSAERTIVGVVSDMFMQDVDTQIAHGIYIPMLQATPFQVRIMLATSTPPLSQVGMLRDHVEAIDPDLPVFEIASLREAIYAEKRILDAFATLFLLFGLGALLLAATGLYGVLSFTVTQRTRELGIRMALGALRRDVVGLVLKQGGRQLALGFAIGLALAFAVGRVLASALEFVDPGDPVVYAGVVSALTAAGLAALLVPVRRAAAITPMEALRREG